MASFRVWRACAEYQPACPQLRLLASCSSRFKRGVGFRVQGLNSLKEGYVGENGHTRSLDCGS